MRNALAAIPDAAPHFDVAVARTLDDYQAVFAIRAISYIAEQHCPFEEEFDGNDFAGATHLIARAGREPIGVIRLRWFADFAKLERAAVTPNWRGAGVARALWLAAADLAARKGYRQILGHIEPALLPFWRRCAGFRPRNERSSFRFSDREYIEALAPLPVRDDALTIDAPPLVLLRPEGAWDQPGVLDQSNVRRARVER